MKPLSMFFRIGLLGALLSIFAAGSGVVRAQTAVQPVVEMAPVAAKAASAGELTQAELLRSYLQLREQLQTMQLAIANSRSEAESTARTQAAAIAEKLETLKSALEAERERRLAETQFANAERQRQQIEMERSNRTLLWIASVFGAVGLIAILLMPLLQWRTLNRMVEITAVRPRLPANERQALMGSEAGAPSDQAVSQSNERLLSMIDRMESRIFELEHTAEHQAPVAPARAVNGANGSEPARRTATDQAALIAVLLGEGRALLSTNKPKEAVACYDELLKLDKNHAEALVRKGAALERLKRDEDALQCYNQAIQADRKMTLAYLYKGGVCNRLARYGEAVECYERALQAEETGA